MRHHLRASLMPISAIHSVTYANAWKRFLAACGPCTPCCPPQEVAREDSETEEEDEYDFEGEYSSRRQRQLQRRLWLVLASLMLVAAGLGVLVYFKWRDGEGVQVPAYR